MATAGFKPRRVLVPLLALTLLATAPQGEAADEPFNPSLEVASSSQVVNTRSNLAIRLSQPDGDNLIQRYNVAIDPTWRFATAGIRASNFTTCGDLAQLPPTTTPVNDMEAIGYASMQLATDSTREIPEEEQAIKDTTGVDGINNTTIDFTGRPAQYTGNGSTGGSQPASIWFLRWAPETATATLCVRVRTTDSRIASENQVIVFQMDFTLRDEGAWDIAFDFDAVDGVPAGFRSVTDNETFLNENVSILELRLTLPGQTGGNFNFDAEGNKCATTSTGAMEPCRVPFSQTPLSPVRVQIAGTFSPCKGAQTGCDPVRRSVEIPISPPGSSIKHDFARLTGPAGPAGVPHGYGIIRGRPDATFTWQQPSLPPLETTKIKGYLLVVAVPGHQETRHFEYMVTNPANPLVDQRMPCGPEGDLAECSVTLSFPLDTVGGVPLGADGKYAVSLITIYEGTENSSAHRTDGRCDDGTPEGIDCPVDEPRFEVVTTTDEGRLLISPGVSTWEFLLRSDDWPLVFMEATSHVYTGCRSQSVEGGICTYAAPFQVLFVDFALRRAEMVVWNAYRTTPGPADTFAASSNAIIGDNAAGGLVSFQSASMTGHTANWRFDGIVGPLGAPFNLPCPSPPSVLPAAACGVFVRYDLKGLPGTMTPGGMPATHIQTFAASRVS